MIYNLLCVFFIYSFIGWCAEVIYAASSTGKFVNRGFLNGPVCPIYGIRIAFVSFLLDPIKDNLFFLYIGAVIVTSVIEWLAGWILEKIFKQKWWDYYNYPFNLNGYICLKFSLIWGFACVFVVNILHPFILHIMENIPLPLGITLLIIFSVVIVCDIIVSFKTAFNLNRSLRQIDDIAIAARNFSDDLGQNLYNEVSNIKKRNEKLKENFEDKKLAAEKMLLTYKEQYEERLEKKYEELLNKRKFGTKRLIKAFPKMRSIKHNEILIELRKRLNHNKNKNDKK